MLTQLLSVAEQFKPYDTHNPVITKEKTIGIKCLGVFIPLLSVTATTANTRSPVPTI